MSLLIDTRALEQRGELGSKEKGKNRKAQLLFMIQIYF